MADGGEGLRVAVVGLGRMGRPMSQHMLEHGLQVFGCDVAEDARRWAQEAGVVLAGSPADAARAAEIVLILTGNEAQVQEVTAGPDGVFSSGGSGVVMIGSTISPELARSLAQAAAEAGYALVDAPCTRGERGAIERNLLWLVGGAAEDVAACRPVMEACGPDVYHLGPVGAGQVAKALNNMLLWAALCADHEALDLAARYGIDALQLRQALMRSSANNWALEHWDDMTNIPWAMKDMDILLHMADSVGADTPLSAVVRDQVATHVRAAGWA